LCKAIKIAQVNFKTITAFSFASTLAFLTLTIKIHLSNEIPGRKKLKLLIAYLALISELFRCAWSITFPYIINKPWDFLYGFLSETKRK